MKDRICYDALNSICSFSGTNEPRIFIGVEGFILSWLSWVFFPLIIQENGQKLKKSHKTFPKRAVTSQRSISFIFILNMCLCLGVCMRVRCQWRLREGVRFSGARVICSCEPPKVDAVCRLGPLQNQPLVVEPAPFWEIFY